MFTFKGILKFAGVTLSILLLPLLIIAAVLAVAQPAMENTENIVAIGDLLSGWSDFLLVIRVCIVVSLVVWWNEIIHWYASKKSWSEGIQKVLLDSRWLFAFAVFVIESSQAIGRILW